MQPNKSSTLIKYGIALLVLGAAAVLFSGKTNQFGLNWDGKTGLFIAGGGGIVAIVLGILARSGKNSIHWGAAAFVFLFMCTGFQRGFATAKKIADNPEVHGGEWFKAVLLGLIFVVSLMALIPLLVFLRREKISK